MIFRSGHREKFRGRGLGTEFLMTGSGGQSQGTFPDFPKFEGGGRMILLVHCF